MFTLKVTNEQGEELILTQREHDYQILGIEGLSPNGGDLNLTTIAGLDGSLYQSSRVTDRQIVLTLKINGNVEKNRIRLYKFFRNKQLCTLYYKNETRNVNIKGYTGTLECDIFSDSEQMQIPITCPQPYFENMSSAKFTFGTTVGEFTFPFAFGANGVRAGTTTDNAIVFSSSYDIPSIKIHNTGDKDKQGFICTIQATGNVANPKIVNDTTGKLFEVDCSMINGDSLIINSLSGQKSIIFRHNNIDTNYIGYIKRGSTWLYITPGENLLYIDAYSGAGNMAVQVEYKNYFQGV